MSHETLGPEIIQAETPTAVADVVADRLLTFLTARTASMQDVHVVLTGGTVAALVHRRTATLSVHRGDAIRWSGVHLWWGDERWLVAEDEERNDGQARRDLLDALPLDPRQVHAFPVAGSAEEVTDDAALLAAANGFAQEMAEHAPDRFDLVMLGAGPDAHVASLFPNHDVDPSSKDVAAVTDSPKPPSRRLTLTEERLSRTRSVWVFATGAGKAEAIAAAHAGADLPLRRVSARAQAAGADVTWFLDAEAGSLLSE